MKKSILAVLLALVVAVSFGACKQDTEAPITKPGEGMPAGHPAPGGEGGIVVPEIKETVVPEDVKATWSGVKLAIEDKESNSTSEVVVNLGETYTIPGSEVNIQVENFLPDFKMSEGVYTSMSNEPNNPAAKIVVTEGESEVFNSWLYSKFPAIHPMMHERFGVTLVEGVKKG
ncbi:MAG: DUF2155 domain-containing protein [Phycisphaerae bacterium]|nr:DUF2155 domain-containing protein [Phycisphaerae bacterium]NIW92635.1 DUF2155 domain-containing protein [Phycisphaerae bacterium]NIW98014.1 DUF2155 domain-containing protein [Phycisphaerae bacterium]